MSTNILKYAGPVISKFFSVTFNKIVSNGIFPDFCKKAKVVPILKEGDNKVPSNYRPISIVSAISKLFEKLIFKLMIKFIQKYKLLREKEFGFREKRSTTHAILTTIDLIRSYIDKKSSVSVCFLDLKKAFDTIDHKILIDKLNHYGFRDNFGLLIKSYLLNRQGTSK